MLVSYALDCKVAAIRNWRHHYTYIFRDKCLGVNVGHIFASSRRAHPASLKHKMRQHRLTFSHTQMYKWSFFSAEIRSGVFSVSASVCDSRNWNSRSNSFVRAPFSGGGSNAPRPAVSVPHLAGIGYVGWARQARSAQIFVVRAVYARAIFGSWHIYAELQRKATWMGQHSIIFKLASFPNWLLISSPPHLFRGHISKRLAYCAYRTTTCCVVAFRYRISRLNTFVRAFVVFEGGRSLPNNIIAPSVRADSSF